jgi:carnitine 3-dehydrogenase
MRHFLAQFGPALKWPWTKLMDTPELTEELINRIAEQSDDQVRGVAIRELERLRDDCLVAVLHGLRAKDYAAGAVVRAHEHRLQGRLATVSPKFNGADAPKTPLSLVSLRVAPEWIDYNGHMTESRYLQCFADASDALLRLVGVDDRYVATGKSYYTVETHIMHLTELKLGAPVRIDTQILAVAGKRLHIFHSLVREIDGAVAATAEQMLLHVDTKSGHTTAPERSVLASLETLAATHKDLPRPRSIGRHVGAGGLS